MDNETWKVEVAYRKPLGALAERDRDFASTENRMGFSRFDTQIGHKLLQMPEGSWTPKQCEVAYKILDRYKNTQLPEMGFDYATLPAPPKVVRRIGDSHTSQARVAVDGDRLVLSWDSRDPVFYDRLAMVRQMPGAVFSRETKHWSVPVTMASAEMVTKMIAAFADRAPFAVDPDVSTVIDAAFIHGDEQLAMSRADDAPDLEMAGIKEPERVRPFQRAGIAYATRNKKVLIADDMGLGKTVQALAAATTLDAKRVLIVCPASLKLNWRREIDMWVEGDRSVMVIEGSRPHNLLRDFGFGRFTIINYDILHGWAEQLGVVPWDVVIADECHMVKSHTARRTRALRRVLEDSNPTSVYMLSGTPMMNRPAEMWPVLDMIGGRAVFRGWDHFANRYCGAMHTRFGFQANGATNLDELNAKLRSGGLMVRRRKTDVMKELPSRQWAELPIAMSKKDERAYADVEIEIATATTPGAALAGIGRLRQTAWEAKKGAAKAWITDFLETGEKLVVFGWHRAAVLQIAEWFNAPVIMGGMKREDIEANKTRFQEDPTCRVMACNVQAGGVGHTLTAASNVLFVEFAWNAAIMDQALDRVHRIGQEADSVTGWMMGAVRSSGEDTVDQMMMDMIAHKREITTAGTDGSTRSVQSRLLGKWREALLQQEANELVEDRPDEMAG